MPSLIMKGLYNTRPLFAALPLQWAGACLSLAFSGLGAQTLGLDVPATTGAAKRAVVVTPRVAVSETFTDNVNLTSVGLRSEQTTALTAGVRVSSDGARIKGYFDYALLANLNVQGAGQQSTQNAMTAFGTVEAIEKYAFLDVSGTISRQAISALGTQSSSTTSNNANLTESTDFRLSPYLKGRMGDVANYEARLGLVSNRSQSALASDTATRDLAIKIASQPSKAVLGWFANASRQNISYSAGRPTESESYTAGLSFTANPHLSFSVDVGQEANNYTTLDKQSSFTSGLGVNWVLSPKTKLNATRRIRSFGQSHSLGFEHNTARTAWRISDSQDVTSTPNQSGVVSIGSTYDLLYAQQASVEPDPVKRAGLVNALLQAYGINPATQVLSNFLASSVSLQRRQELTFALLGIRDTVTFIANRSEISRLDSLSTAIDDLANGSVVRQNGLSVNYAHRLTPNAAFNVLASAQQSSSSATLQETMMRTVNVSLTTRLGNYSSATLGARRVMFDSVLAPYVETAITGSLNLQF